MPRFSPHQNVVNYNAHGKRDRVLLGIFLMAFGETILVGMAAAIKHLSSELPLLQIIFFRNALALVVLIPFIFRVGLTHLKTKKINIHFLRALFGVSAMLCMFYIFANLRLSEAVLLKATSPIMLSLMAWLVLRERVSLLGWCAILMAFVGVLVILGPNAFDLSISLGFLIGITGALLAALAKIMVRRLGRSDSSEVIVFYFAAFGTVFTLPFAITVWQPVFGVQWFFLCLIAVFATFGQLCITKAYTVAPAARVAMFSYLSLPVAGLLGWFLWSETIDLPLLLGTAIIVVAGCLSFYVSRRDQKQVARVSSNTGHSERKKTP